MTAKEVIQETAFITGCVILTPVAIVGYIAYCIIISPFVAVEDIIHLYKYGTGPDTSGLKKD